MGFQKKLSNRNPFLNNKIKTKEIFLVLVQNSKVNPWFVTGFCDGEASFGVSIYIDKIIKGRLGWAVIPSFQISLNSKDITYYCNCKIFWLWSNREKTNSRWKLALE